MANFDAIFDENLQEDERGSRASDEHVRVTPEPVVIRGVGHMTVWVVSTIFKSSLIRKAHSGGCVLQVAFVIANFSLWIWELQELIVFSCCFFVACRFGLNSKFDVEFQQGLSAKVSVLLHSEHTRKSWGRSFCTGLYLSVWFILPFNVFSRLYLQKI